jgi:uncharacterized protein
MSEENVEIVRRGYRAFAEGDLGTLLDFVDPEIEVIPPRRNPDWQVYNGREGLLTFMVGWFEPWDEYRIEPQEFIDAGDRVVVVTRDRGRNEQTGLEVEQRLHSVFTMRDRKGVRMEMFFDRAEALEAAGLSEEDAHNPDS